MRKMDSKTAAEIGKMGGDANAERIKSMQTEYDDMTFEEIVNKYTTGADLMALYKGLMASGKKGSVKATETILKYLNKKEDEDKNEFAL